MFYDLERELLALVVAGRGRRHDLLGELANERLEASLFVREVEVHG
jgi:hypothetical protein